MSAVKKEKSRERKNNASNLKSTSNGGQVEQFVMNEDNATNQTVQLKLDFDNSSETVTKLAKADSAPGGIQESDSTENVSQDSKRKQEENDYDENHNIFDVEETEDESKRMENASNEFEANRKAKEEPTDKSTIPTASVQSGGVKNSTVSDRTNGTKKNAKNKKEKLSKFEKRKIKRKKQEDLLNLRGIPKYVTSFAMETLYIFLVEMILKLLVGNFAFDYTILRIFLSSAAFGLLFTVLTNNMPFKLRRGTIIAIDWLIVFYAWLQIGFLNFLGAFMSVGNIEQGAKTLDYVVDFLASYSPVIHTIFIPFVLVIVFFIFERHITRDGFATKIPFKSLIVDVALLVGMGILAFSYYATLELDFMQNKYQMISNKELFISPSNPVVSIKNFGTTMYLILDVESAIFGSGERYYVGDYPDGSIDSEETDYSREIDDAAWESLIRVETDKDYTTLNNYFYNRQIVDKNDYTGIFEGKNLIMVMLESIPEPLFHEEFKEYFPTFYKLYNEGITAENNYSPINNCGTGESERTSQTSVYSIETTCTVNTYKQNEYQQALLYMFRKNGYTTSTYHDYDNTYYDRDTYEYKLGAMRYYNALDLGMTLSPYYSEWPSDSEFMKLAIPNFIDQEKYAAYIITVTAHTPYSVDSAMSRKNMELFADTDFDITTKRFLSKAKEADLALEYLLNELEESGKLDDTVIVLFGDHYPYALTDKNYQDLAQYDISVNNEVDRTPFIIYNSTLEPEKIVKYTSPMDYTPTLLNLFGIEYDPRLYLGNDIFSDYTDYVLFQDNSWQNAYGFYSSSKGEFIPNEGAELLSDEEIIAINKDALAKRDMSGLAIKKDYFAYLFKYFDEYKKLEETKEKEENEDESENDSSKNTEEK